MSHIIFDDNRIELNEGQTVLSALLDHGYEIPNSCRAGACQTCLMKAVEGEIPAEAQTGLKDTLKAQGYFMACSCKPDSPLHISTNTNESLQSPAIVVEHEMLNKDILCIRLKPQENFEYKAGQFITVWKDAKVGRSYSLASVYESDDFLELHIRRIPDGIVSNWLHDEVKTGDTLKIQAASGNCFYISGTPEQKILLAGTGTGLAPLIGIARDALKQKHSGDIHLVHGTRHVDDLYMHQTLLDMKEKNNQFNYLASVLQGDESQSSVSSVAIEEQLIDVAGDLKDCKIYLCGDPEMINNLKRKLFMAGASMNNIHSDSFIASNT